MSDSDIGQKTPLCVIKRAKTEVLSFNNALTEFQSIASCGLCSFSLALTITHQHWALHRGRGVPGVGGATVARSVSGESERARRL